MTTIKKRHGKKTKFKAVVDLLQENHTVSELCSKYGIHQSALFRWKKDFLEKGPDFFDKSCSRGDKSKTINQLERKIGELTMDVDFLNKALGR
tara:strand:- start:307 stop:585 length:279 start_codon:yes stop_codon:yes gene_type:complete